MSDTKQQNSYPLRMPPELRQQLEARAAENSRSMNAEIVAILQRAIEMPTCDLRTVSSGELLHEVIARYGEAIRIEIGGTATADLKNHKG